MKRSYLKRNRIGFHFPLCVRLFLLMGLEIDNAFNNSGAQRSCKGDVAHRMRVSTGNRRAKVVFRFPVQRLYYILRRWYL